MKLSTSIFKAIFLVATFASILAFFISLFFQYSGFKADQVHMKEEYIQFKKDEIKREVLKVHEYINFQQKLIKKNLRTKLKDRVNQAHTIATAIYEENKNGKTTEELKYLIVTALKNISFSEKRAYFFINSNKGKAVLFNKKSKLNKNINVWNLKDIKGRYIIQGQSKIALEKGEGFVTNYFIKPDLNDNIEYPKLSYIKNFEPFNWHIGTGEYLDDVAKNIQKDILDWVASIRFGEDGYIFVNSTKQKALIFDGKRLDKPKHYSNEVLYQQQINAVKNKEGDFFFYKFKKLNTIKEYPKMAYVKLFENWGWIIGSGVYIDEIDEVMQRKELLLMRTVMQQISTVLIVILLLAVVIYMVSKKISKVIDMNVEKLILSFTNASKRRETIDTKQLSYQEFTTLAMSLNEILNARNEAEEKLQDYLDIVNENVIISSTDLRGKIETASEAFCKISGFSKEELIGRSHSIVRHPDMPKSLYEGMWKRLKQGFPWSGEIKNRRKDGTSYWVYTIIHPTLVDGVIVGYTAIRQDITDKKQVEYLSQTDELTRLYNRRYFNIRIEEEILRAKREDHYLAFLLLDVDYFKKYNDTYGHQAGDRALKSVADVLISHTNRASDFAFRLGGEEFGVIFSFEDEVESYRFAELIRNDVENLKVEHKKSSVSNYLTVSIGLVVRDSKTLKTSEMLYKDADEALYEAKAKGRNCTQLSKVLKES